MRPSIRLALIMATCATYPSLSSAQLTLEVQQGSAWANSITIPPSQPIHFRWKWDGPTAPPAASWQITFTDPASANFPPVVKTVSTAIPGGQGRYASFDIAPDDIPAGAPSRFYVRIRSTNIFSEWVPVLVAQRAGVSRGTETNLGAGLTLPAAPPPAEAAKPFVIPGGGGGVDPETPLWVNLSGMPCWQGNDAQMYAIIATIKPTPQDPMKSPILVTNTPIQNPCGNSLPIQTVIWGPVDSKPMPLHKRNTSSEGLDGVMMVAVLKRNTDRSLGLVKTVIAATLLGRIASLGTGWTVSDISQFMRRDIENMLVSADGDELIGIAPVPITQQDLAKARSGELVKLNFEVKHVQTGSVAPFGSLSRPTTAQIVWFQLGNVGVSPVKQ